ncbi:MAG: cytochrome c oxidase, subunit VIb [Monoraphidium minutum]|nr:MAG: cytochrome c oxidase, subunit VIb [Monoraphidium minutum]
MKEPTAKEVEAAKAEIVSEVVDKIVSNVGDELLVNEVVTAPYDPRFPATNQARHCFVRYNEYYKCVFERGAEAQRCGFYKRAYESMCPEEWVDEWEELREKGLWMGKY